MADIPTAAFVALRRHFFDEHGAPKPFALRPKRNTQDDPLDEYLANEVLAKLPGISCVKAPGPLVTPDIVLLREVECRGAQPIALADDLTLIAGIEVKKLERTRQGGVARPSGLDYNTTPPCGHVTIYDSANRAMKVRGFYLFLCIEADAGGKVVATAMVLVDGDLLNADYDYYLSVVGEREKKIGLGTYGDGADRARPMLIFSNPLGVPEFDRAATLIHPDPALPGDEPRKAYDVVRTDKASQMNRFSAYRVVADLPADYHPQTLSDPFRVPSRDTRTRPRGRFRLPFKLA